MTITRVTQNMMMNRSQLALQTGLSRLAKTQEQLTTGRVLNRPSDSPTDATSAMRMRAALAEQAQYKRNAQDGLGWLGTIDTELQSQLSQLRRARDIAIQGANASNASPQAREALAVEVEQIRESLLAGANTTYLGRPVFGGLTNGTTAYNADGTPAGRPVADGVVTRTVGNGVKVRVDVNAEEAFGTPGDDMFKNLDDLVTALRTQGPVGEAAIQTAIGKISEDQTRMTTALAEVGTRYNRLEQAVQKSVDTELSLSSTLSEVENVDLAKATLDLGLHEVAYQAALASTARLVQPSLVDFLR